MISDKKFVGQKFKAYRKKMKITQEEIAEKTGITDKHYGKLERGVFSPSLETFFKIVEILEIPLSDFGINELIENPLRKKLMKEICTLNDKELSLYSEILKTVKKYKA